MTLKIKHLKVKTNSDWLAYQRWLPVALRAKAEQLGIPSKYLVPLKLTKAAPVSQISKAIDDCNQRFDDLCRFIRNSDASDVSKAEAGKAAKGFLEARGIAQGSLADVDVMNPEFDGVLSDALGIHENQHHPNWDKVYPEAKRMPESILEAGVQHRDQDFRSIAGRFDRSAGPVNTISEGVYSQSAVNIS